MVAVVALVWSVGLAISFEPSDEQRNAATAGSSLRLRAVLALVVLGGGLLFGAASTWGKAAASYFRLGAAIIALAMLIPATVTAHRRLHPSFAVERRAVSDFEVPGGGAADVSTEVGRHRQLTASWAIPGTEHEICAQVLQAAGGWADPGSLGRPSPPLNAYSRVARRGPDDVRISCYAGRGPGSPVYLMINLERVR